MESRRPHWPKTKGAEGTMLVCFAMHVLRWKEATSTYDVSVRCLAHDVCAHDACILMRTLSALRNPSPAKKQAHTTTIRCKYDPRSRVVGGVLV